MGDILFSCFLGIDLTYLLARRRSHVAKSCVRGGD